MKTKTIRQAVTFKANPHMVYEALMDSRVTFSLKGFEKGTRLTFTQSNVPEAFYEEISRGWHDFYWTPMKEMFKE